VGHPDQARTTLFQHPLSSESALVVQGTCGLCSRYTKSSPMSAMLTRTSACKVIKCSHRGTRETHRPARRSRASGRGKWPAGPSGIGLRKAQSKPGSGLPAPDPKRAQAQGDRHETAFSVPRIAAHRESRVGSASHDHKGYQSGGCSPGNWGRILL
jgi:hypothetical protein